MRALQRELSADGHEPGAIDGEWGENTRQALRDFQRERDLEPTGTLTLPTLAALGVDLTNERGEAGEIGATAQREGEVLEESERDAVAEERD